MGKNWVTPAMTARPQEPAFQVIYVATVTIGRPDFYRQRSFGLAPHGTIAVGFEAVRREARTCQADHRLHPVLVIDEAHLMPDATLSHLHVLANFDMDSRPLLSLVSVGLPELQDRLRLGVHRSLLTRIGTMVDIGPATPDDTAACVRHRLEGAGSTRERFASDGILMLDELAAALRYLVNQRGPLTLFLTNPRVPIHNNLSERELRIVALLRKNALFVGSDEGGRNLAMLLSMSATCRLHGVDPERWLADVLIGVQEETTVEPLLPWNWKHGRGLVARPVFATA
jgi:hypothetical protein